MTVVVVVLPEHHFLAGLPWVVLGKVSSPERSLGRRVSLVYSSDLFSSIFFSHFEIKVEIFISKFSSMLSSGLITLCSETSDLFRFCWAEPDALLAKSSINLLADMKINAL